MGAANTGGTGDSKSVTKKKAEKDIFVSGAESVSTEAETFSSQTTSTQKDKEKAEANVEMNLGQPDFTSVTKDVLNPNNNIQEKKKTTTTNIGNGNNDGGNNNQVKVTEPVILKKNIGGTTVQTTEAKVAEDKKESEKEYDARITKKKGRRKNILTSSTGVTQTSPNYSLGKPTLLGMV